MGGRKGEGGIVREGGRKREGEVAREGGRKRKDEVVREGGRKGEGEVVREREGGDGREDSISSTLTIPVRVSTLCVILAEWVQGWSVCHMIIPTKLLNRKWAALGGSNGNTCNTT